MRTKLLLTGIAALFLATGTAHAQSMVLMLPPPEYDDREAFGRKGSAVRTGVLLCWRRIHRMERVYTSEEKPAEVSV